MRAVHRKYLKTVALEPAHPASDLRRGAIPDHSVRVLVDGEASFPLREAPDRTKIDPALRGPPRERAQQVAQDRNPQERERQSIQRQTELEQEAAAGRRCQSRELVVGAHGVPSSREGAICERPENLYSFGRPTTGARWAAIQATRSDTCSELSGVPCFPRQSGIPRSVRPAITAVRSA